MKKICLFLFISSIALPAWAQKSDMVAKLCKRWLIDTQATAQAIQNNPDAALIMEELAERDIYIQFYADGKVTSNQGDPDEEEGKTWRLSPDKTTLFFGSGTADAYRIKTLTAKKLVLESVGRQGIAIYFVRIKDSYPLRQPKK